MNWPKLKKKLPRSSKKARLSARRLRSTGISRKSRFPAPAQQAFARIRFLFSNAGERTQETIGDGRKIFARDERNKKLSLKKPLENLMRVPPPDERDIILVEIYGIRPR